MTQVFDVQLSNSVPLPDQPQANGVVAYPDGSQAQKSKKACCLSP